MKIHLAAFGIARGPIDVDESAPAGPQLRAAVREYPEYDGNKSLTIMNNVGEPISAIKSFTRSGVNKNDVVIVNHK
jgi:hypothetical protein